MKRISVISILLVSLLSFPAGAQVGKFLKNVKNSVTQDILGTSDKDNTKPAPEPPCACNPAAPVIDLGKYKIVYSELNIDVLSDGRIILQDKMNSSYYVVREGVTEGPLKENDPRVRQFEQIVENDDYDKALEVMYKDYISKQGDKYVITFAGKTYGPYGRIEKFEVTRSGNKFAASVVENVVVTEDEGDAMEKAVANAKTDQEKQALAMKYAQQMQQKIMSGGGPSSMSPKLVSNIPVEDLDVLTLASSSFNSKMKYDDILLVSQNRITDLQGKTIFNLPAGQYTSENTFVSEDNSRYATYSYGTLTISDGKVLSELFNPYLIKTDGKVYLTYMYYSPGSNSIMQCKISF